MSSRAKRRGRGKPLEGRTAPLPEIVHRDVKPSNGRSLGFGRDRARKYGRLVPPVGGSR